MLIIIVKSLTIHQYNNNFDVLIFGYVNKKNIYLLNTYTYILNRQ